MKYKLKIRYTLAHSSKDKSFGDIWWLILFGDGSMHISSDQSDQ